MYTSVQNPNKNKYIKRFRTSVSQQEDQAASSNNNNYKSDLHKSHIIDSSFDSIIRYRQHIEFLEKKLFTQQHFSAQIQHKYQALSAQKQRLALKIKSFMNDKAHLSEKLREAEQRIEGMKEDVQLQKLRATITQLERNDRDSISEVNSSWTFRKPRNIDNPEQFYNYLQKQSRSHKKKSFKMMKKLELDRNIGITIFPDAQMATQNMQQQKNQNTKIQKMEQAIIYLNNKLKVQQQVSVQNTQQMMEKQKIIQNFSKQNRQLKTLILQMEKKEEQLQSQMIAIQQNYSYSIKQSENMTDLIKSKFQEIIGTLQEELKKIKGKNEQLIDDCERWKHYSIEQETKIRNLTEQYETKMRSMSHSREVQDLQNCYKNMKNKYEESLEQIENLKEQKEEVSEKAQKLSGEIKSNEAKMIQMTVQLKQRAQFIKQLKRNQQEASKSIANSYKLNQEKLQETNNDLSTKIKAKQQKILFLSDQNKELNNQIEEKERIIKKMIDQLEIVKQIFEREKIDNESQTQQTNTVNMEDLEAHISEIMTEKNQNIQALENENENLRQQINGLQKQIESVTEQSERSQLYLQAAKRKIEEMEENFERYENELKERDEEINELKQNIESFEERQVQYKQFIGQMRASGVSTYEE